MSKTLPINHEAPFEVHELFFSKTDKKGIILSGNNTFVRVSGHPRERLIQAPHNIIRHPDMPKTIFKLFWDTLHQNQPIGAYVKNMARDGSYYWVFASVWPTDDGYVSIRLKPTSKILGIVQKLYDSVRADEKNSDLNKMIEGVLQAISGLGFSNYQEFMAAALTSELISREQILSEKKHTPPASIPRNSNIGKVLLQSSLARNGYEEIFSSLIHFQEIGKSIKTHSENILKSFKTLGFLSINIAAVAEKTGEEGRTLSEVANGFNKVAEEIRTSIEIFLQSMTEILNVWCPRSIVTVWT